MHAGKRPCAPFRCDDVTKMKEEGLDALENAVRHNCALASTADTLR